MILDEQGENSPSTTFVLRDLHPASTYAGIAFLANCSRRIFPTTNLISS